MDEKVVRGIIGSLLTARNDAKEQTATFSPEIKGTFRVVSREGKFFVLGPEGISCLDHAVDLIAADELLGEYFSRTFLSDKISRLIPILLSVNDENLPEKTTEHVKLLIKDLEKSTALHWKIALPITNLVLKIPPLQIGRVCIMFLGGGGSCGAVNVVVHDFVCVGIVVRTPPSRKRKYPYHENGR